jgi:hypothetical protein
MIKYQINRYYYIGNRRPIIEPVEVVKETACFVTVRRLGYNGQFSDTRLQKDWTFHETFESAKQKLIDRASNSLEQARKNVDKYEAEIEALQALTP